MAVTVGAMGDGVTVGATGDAAAAGTASDASAADGNCAGSGGDEALPREEHARVGALVRLEAMRRVCRPGQLGDDHGPLLEDGREVLPARQASAAR